MPQVSLGQQIVTYRDQGSGAPPLLLVHGAGGSSLHFAELLGLLSPHRRVLALDLPGHGRSPAPAPTLPPEELLERYRDTVVELAERLGLGRFVLVGHSLGGAVGLQVALGFPDRLAGLVLLATAARLKVAPALLEVIRQRFPELPDLLAAVGYSPTSDRGKVASWAALQIQSSREVMLADFLACASFDLRPRLGEIRCPTLVLSAADDQLTPPQLQERLASAILGARLLTVPRAGHFLCLERPDVVAEAILSLA